MYLSLPYRHNAELYYYNSRLREAGKYKSLEVAYVRGKIQSNVSLKSEFGAPLVRAFKSSRLEATPLSHKL